MVHVYRYGKVCWTKLMMRIRISLCNLCTKINVDGDLSQGKTSRFVQKYVYKD